MPVKVRCPGCQKVLNAPDQARGKVVKCPQCGDKIKVPAGGAATGKKPKPKAKEPSASDSADFLSGLNVSQLEAEHGEEKVCPYCAADMPNEEDPVCRKCGMNTATGQMDEKESRKRARKGPDPELFYKEAWTGSWEFLQKHWRLAVRTGLIWTAFLTISWSSSFHAWMWVLEGAGEGAEAAVVAPGEEPEPPFNPLRSPPLYFFLGMSLLFSLGVPGWYWSLSIKIIDHTMQREELKEDRVQFDMFEAIAMGMRVYFWPAILMLPALPVWIAALVIFGGGLGVLTGGSPLVMGPLVIGLLLSYIFMPYLVFPQALVHMSVRHRFKAWILWEQLLVLFKNLPATLYWWLVAICVFLPSIILLTLFLLFAGDASLKSYELLDSAGAWIFGFIMDVGEPGKRGIFFKILHTPLIYLLVAPFACIYAFLLAFPALFMMRANGLYGFYRRETLGLVTHVKPNQLAGFWVRFLTHSIDYAVIAFFLVLMFALPNLLVALNFPLGRYFGAGIMAAINVGFVAIAGSKNPKASVSSLLLGAVAGMTFMYAENIPIFGTLQAFMPLVMWLVNSWMHFCVNEASTSRSTIGKEGFGLITQTVDKGAELTLQQASLRHFGRILCDLTLGLGYVIAGFHPKKQALHDLMAKSTVVFRGDN